MPRLLLAFLLLFTAPVRAAEDVAVLVGKLEAEDARVRYDALRALGRLGKKAEAARAAVLAAVQDAEPFVRFEAARAFVRIGPRKEDAARLVKLLRTTDFETGHLVCEALALLGGAAVPPLVEELAEEGRRRTLALTALAAMGPPAAPAVPLLIEIVAAGDEPAARKLAAEALRRAGPWATEYVPEIVDTLRFAESEEARWLAARVLGWIGPAAERAVPHLKTLQAEGSPRLKEAAGDALKLIDVAVKKKTHPALRDPALAREQAPARFRVKLETSKGDLVIEVIREWAPHGADRFYNLARIGFFDDTAFFRVLDGFVAQFGLNGDSRVNGVWATRTIPDDPRTQSNARGTVSFAKTDSPNSRATQLFLNLGNNAKLDEQGFAPIGRLVEGMEVADALFSGYGDAPPRGEGPDQRGIVSMGNEYLKRRFHRLDWIKRTTLLPQ